MSHTWRHDPDGPNRLVIHHDSDHSGPARIVVNRKQVEHLGDDPDTIHVTVPGPALAAFGQDWHDAGLAVDAAWDRYSRAATPTEAARALVALDDAMSDLASFLPGYDAELGRVPYDDEIGESR